MQQCLNILWHVCHHHLKQTFRPRRWPGIHSYVLDTKFCIPWCLRKKTKLFNTSHDREKLRDLHLGTHLHISRYNSTSHFHEICGDFMTTPSISATKFIAHKFIATKLGETIHSLYKFFFCVILRAISLK